MKNTYDFKTQRLHVDVDLAENTRIDFDKCQSNYLVNVLRCKNGDRILVFNGRDGEWLAEFNAVVRRKCQLTLLQQTRLQDSLPDLHYLFAPLKHARLDYLVQKAVEMGVGTLRPVMTQHTQSNRINLERVKSNVFEACEQCGVISIPEVCEIVKLDELISNWTDSEGQRRIVYCDEADGGENPMTVLKNMEPGPIAVLVGPEGGFSEPERKKLREQEFVTPLPLGPRIMRADTAAVAALAVVQAVLGDWT